MDVGYFFKRLSSSPFEGNFETSTVHPIDLPENNSAIHNLGSWIDESWLDILRLSPELRLWN